MVRINYELLDRVLLVKEDPNRANKRNLTKEFYRWYFWLKLPNKR